MRVIGHWAGGPDQRR